MHSSNNTESIFQDKYSNSIHAQARAANAVKQIDGQSVKQAINEMVTLTQCALMSHYMNVKGVSITRLLKHKSDALEMYRKVVCLNLAMKEETILLGYIKHIILALDDAINVKEAKPSLYIA